MQVIKGKFQKIWLTISLAVMFVMGILFVSVVELSPQVSPDFFFGSDDPEMADTRKIAEKFPAEEFLIINVAGSEIFSRAYLLQVERMTARLQDLNAFNRVLSITNGPDTAAAAAKSPFWHPLLIDADQKSTFILAFLPRESPRSLISAVEEILAEFQGGAHLGAISVSGMPYIAEHIKRSIVRDAQIFSAAALVVFTALIFMIYRSWVIALGACISGVGAIFASLTMLHFLGQAVGILTANLAIIIFVLVQSQIIYLTSNWRRQSGTAAEQVIDALHKTVRPSFWCAVTTLLGFASLLFVSAEPLRQLGLGGVVGVIVAFLSCFCLFPAFLLYAQRKAEPALRPVKKTGHKLSFAISGIGSAILFAGMTLTIPGLLQLNTDPGLLSYFEEDSDIGSGLREIDANGGSSPLLIVVSLKTGDDLDNSEAYEKLSDLHQKLAAQPNVGTVLSLPALLAEANSHPLAFLLPWREIVTLLGLEVNQQAVKSFLSEDRKDALFLLRMKEQAESGDRLAAIGNLQTLAQEDGFRADLVGGVYALQARLSALVAQSIVTGILSLLVIFFIIAGFATRRLALSVSMGIAAGTIPLLILGGAGTFKVPMDVISAPAISVAFGLAVDAIIHLGLAVRRKMQELSVRESWRSALAEQAGGILAANGIIALGFMIFAFSEFPPTVRFGGMIVAGAFVAMLSSLTLLPLIAKSAENLFKK